MECLKTELSLSDDADALRQRPSKKAGGGVGGAEGCMGDRNQKDDPSTALEISVAGCYRVRS